MSQLGICVGFFLLAMAFFQHDTVWSRRMGLWLIFVTMGVGLWFATNSVVIVVLGFFTWFAIPIGQAMWMSRRLPIPRHRSLNQEPMNIEDFPELPSLSRAIRDMGFQGDADYWLKPSPMDQGFRVFVKDDHVTYASVAVIRQGGVSLSYIIYMTPLSNGEVWLTWDYPLAYFLKMPPHLKIYRCLEAHSVEELYEMHEAFLEVNEVKPEEPTSEARENASRVLEEMFSQTLEYNLKAGLLHTDADNDERVQYSWRGTFYISWQVFLEMVKG